ncbi:MAG: DUF1592 domain-containing protein [Verrucomicrobiota bacterium]
MVALGALMTGLATDAAAADSHFARTVQPFLKEHCFECHDNEVQKGDLNLTALAPEFRAPPAMVTWAKVLDRLESGEMPPKKKPRPPQAAAGEVTRWLNDNLEAAVRERQQREGRVTLRRLNRVEYQNTIHDLLGIEVNVMELLPEDGIAHGFDKIDTALTLSPVQMEKYLEAADLALDTALGVGPRPQVVRERFGGTNFLASWATQSSRILPDGSLVLFNSGYSPTELRRFRSPAPGRYRVRVSASAFQSTQPVTLRVYAGNFNPGGKTKLSGHYDMPPNKSAVIEFTERLDGRGETFKLAPYGTITWQNQGATHTGPGLAVQWIEIEGPLEAQQWPPATRRQLLGNVSLDRGTLADAQTVLRQFAPRAFRRPVSDADIEPFVKLVQERLTRGVPFGDAVRVGLKAILVSPRFLMLDEQPGKLDDYALAARLSYFLWSAAPDDALLAAAAKKELSRPDALRAQVERMLKHPKARAFTENFTGQWLGLRNIEFTTPDARLYPEFDELLQVSMVKETHAFFDEILRQDLSLLNFIQSDFAMLNERLAKHYGIPGVTGLEMRRVPLRPEWHRGGVLAHASVLKVTANGTTTSPVLRGVWVLDRIIGRPAPPPPPNVPAVEPDIRGAKSIRDQLARHREVETCASCHARIDPIGFALENYDVIGAWRERYRISPERGQRAEYIMIAAGGRDHRVAIGPAVSATDALPDGRRFRNLEELKKLLLDDKDAIARGLTEKLLTYATGHGLEFTDQRVVREIATRVAGKSYGFRTLIHEIVQCETFQNK